MPFALDDKVCHASQVHHPGLIGKGTTKSGQDGWLAEIEHAAHHKCTIPGTSAIVDLWRFLKQARCLASFQQRMSRVARWIRRPRLVSQGQFMRRSQAIKMCDGVGLNNAPVMPGVDVLASRYLRALRVFRIIMYR